MPDPIDRLSEQVESLKVAIDVFFFELEELMSDKIVKFPVNPKTDQQKVAKGENPFNVDPSKVKPRPGGMGGCVVFGTAYHGPDGVAEEVKLQKPGKNNETDSKK